MFLIFYISKVELGCQFQILDLLLAMSTSWVSYVTSSVSLAIRQKRSWYLSVRLK